MDQSTLFAEGAGDKEVLQMFHFVPMLRHQIAEHLVITTSKPE
jgi:hypothetical protein